MVRGSDPYDDGAGGVKTPPGLSKQAEAVWLAHIGAYRNLSNRKILERLCRTLASPPSPERHELLRLLSRQLKIKLPRPDCGTV